MRGPSDLESLVRGYLSDGDAESHDLAVSVFGNGRDMWLRSEFDPGHFTASAFVVSPDRSSLLLIHHRNLDRWLQPGGHIEPFDETIEDAARREVEEETGVSGLVRLGTSLARIDVHEIPQRGREPTHMHLDLGLGFLAESTEIGPIDEVLEARWVPFDELDSFGADDALLAGARVARSASG